MIKKYLWAYVELKNNYLSMIRVKTHTSQNLFANFFKSESYLLIKRGEKKRSGII